MKKLLLIVVAATGLMTACGGGAYYSEGRYRRGAPVVYGAYGVAPGPGYVWISPYDDWRGRRYVRVPGRWARPPQGRTYWAPGYWENRGRTRIWIGAQWR